MPAVVEFIVLEQPSAKQQRSRQYGSLDECIAKHRSASMRGRLRAALQLKRAGPELAAAASPSTAEAE